MNIETLKNLLFYNPETGVFLHRKRRSGVLFAGARAGSVSLSRGLKYENMHISGRMYKSHRLAWLYVYGEMPDGEIDHINGNTLDNRICNLRDVTRLENCKNKTLRVDNESGVPGVQWCNTQGKYQARISENGKRIHLGWFDDLELAKKARMDAEVKYGYHINHGRKKTESSRHR